MSTALVESYRDASGKPRQRILANLYGAETPLEALAKLAAQRERWRKEGAFRQSELDNTAETYKAITMGSLINHRFSPAERKKIDRFLWERNHVEARIKEIDSALARIQKDGVVIGKHCDASQAEIQAAIRRYKKQLDDAEKGALGAAFMHYQAKEKLRSMLTRPCTSRLRTVRRPAGIITRLLIRQCTLQTPQCCGFSLAPTAAGRVEG